MTTAHRSAQVALAVVSVLLTVAACDTTTTGTATTPAVTSSDPTSTKATPRTSKTSTPGPPLAALKPCELLADAAKAQLGITEAGAEKKISGARTCQWRVRGETESVFFNVQLWDSDGISDLPDNANKKSLPDIGGRKAVQTKLGAGDGSCAVSLFVSDSTMAAASVVAGVDTEQACRLAQRAAELMEPQLP
ncbi:DUF3558 domain-containing protein [Actinokineospora enzanensis]|uniref:DUF3558 domain-containing protein n=1 Tax=Actinokineospora enzanensis TaxID=155975 RepID=UPI00035F5C90|nr:DUF3558 domain-containing protein [Actinokineospora enzanensis]